jgi:serine/threonine protein kinase
LVGETLGQYRLTKELGKGGFATVYRALQPALNRHVAIKILHPEYVRDQRALRRFKREALAVARLNHPNIVTVFDYGEHEGRAYLVMEYIEGSTLKGRLGKPVSYTAALELVTAVASALDYAHSKGLVHRDIKPANILFTNEGRIVLSDFGIVRLADDQSSLTRGVIGTPYYMSPEQALGREVDGRSDLYSLGVVLFEMLTGRVPFKGESPIATLSMHASLPVPSARELNTSLTAGIDRVSRIALAKTPDERFQNGMEFRSALAEAIADAERPAESTIVAAVPDWSAATNGATGSGTSQSMDVESMYRQLLDMTRLEDWRNAVGLAAQILSREPNYRDVNVILASASNELRYGRSNTSVDMQVRDLTGQAQMAIATGRLMEAASMLEQILRVAPNEEHARGLLEDVNERLAAEAAERQRANRLDRLYILALGKVRAEDWRWANHILEEIVAIDPEYRDVPELIVKVRSAMGDDDYNLGPKRIATLRDQAETAMDEERWAEAVDHWEEVFRLEPGLAGVRESLEIARHHATLTALNSRAAELAANGRWEEAIETLEEAKALTAS